MDKVKLRILSPLDKVFPDEEPKLVISSGKMLKNERYNFFVAFYQEESDVTFKNLSLKIKGIPDKYTTVRKVDFVPANYVLNPFNRDDYILSDKAGLYPDVLRDLREADLILPPRKWESVLVSIDGRKAEIKPDEYLLEIALYDDKTNKLATSNLKLEVIDALLPENDLKITQWIHFDCIAAQHGKKVFSNAFYKTLKSYLSLAVDNGQTVLLTPLFTFALDTDAGRERDTFQLVDVFQDNNEFSFGFEKLKEFINFAFQNGIKYIEFSHLFTQWGGEHAPKIIAEKDGKKQRIFGWDTDSLSVEYIGFLDALLPALMRVIKDLNIENRCYFHLTDEPQEQHFERYKRLSEIVKKHIGSIPIMDALSDYKFAKEKLIDIPVVATNHTAEFVKDGAEFWIYYCCAQSSDYLSNRFLCFPSQRNRILGAQLYLNNIKGFLQWGLNFYNSARSLRKLNPYITTDADGCFPAGDAFVVYPSENGAYSSIRLEVFYDGIQDYLALKALENVTDRRFVEELIKKQGISGFGIYPRDALWHIAFREEINRLIRINTKTKQC